MTIAGFVEFEFQLLPAFLHDLKKVFSTIVAAPLDKAHVEILPDKQGVYQLLHKGKVVYIGKTDGKAGLRRRLSKHTKSIQHRHNLVVTDMTFKAAQVLVLTAMDVEEALIEYYTTLSTVPMWNGSGFGTNDPGRERDTTKSKPTSFDTLFPVNIDIDIDWKWLAPTSTVAETLRIMSEAVPYYLRVGTLTKKKSATALKVPIVMPPRISVRAAILNILAILPAGWQATLLAGRIILYEEAKPYPHGTVIGRS